MGARKWPAVEGLISINGAVRAGEAVSLPGSGAPVLKRSEAQQSEPVRMGFAGHQLPWAFANALGKLTAHVAPMVKEESQQIQVWIAQVAAQREVVAQPRVEVLHQRTAAWGPRHGFGVPPRGSAGGGPRHGLAPPLKARMELPPHPRPRPVPPPPIRGRGDG